MAIPKSGKLSLSEIVVNFNPDNNSSPHKISEYYRGHPNGNVKDFVSNKSIPTSGEIKWSDFYGTGLQSEYYWPIPELCTDSFHLFGKGVENWDQVQDSTNEYVGRDDTEASMTIPVFNESATITIPALKFEIGSELGEDLRYERILENTSTVARDLGLPTTSFAPGEWRMIVPKKFKRLRIMISSGGGSGSVQKTIVSGDELKNRKTKGIVELGYDGRDSTIWMEDAAINLRGGAGGGDVSEVGGVIKTGNLYDQTLSTPENPIVSGGFPTSYENKSSDTPTEYIVSNTMVPANGSISFGRNNFPINILHKVSYIDNRGHAVNRESGLGEDSLFGTGGAPGIEYTYSGARQTEITQVSDISFGVGGAAGQHGGRGSEESGYTGTEAGQAGITGYFGDFEVNGGDIINITVGAGGKNSKNQFNDIEMQTFPFTQSSKISESGYGGDGIVQIIGSHGHSHSKLTHPGWILEDDSGDILASSYAKSVSVRGVTTFQGSMTSARSVDVMGSNDVNNPKMYRLRFSARIGKNGDVPMKTRFCHLGKKSVKVDVLGRKIFLNSPALEGLYNNPDTSLTVEQVSGSYRPRDQTDFEDIDNWFISTCPVKFELTHRSSYSNTATFTKVASTAVATNRGGGPASFTLSKSQSVVEFRMASQERYVLTPQNLDGTGRSVESNNRVASYVRNRNQMQLDDSGAMNSFASADMAVTYEGMGGFYLSGNSPAVVQIDKTNSNASGVQRHPEAHLINYQNGNGLTLVEYNSNWTIKGGSISTPKKLTPANFPELFHNIDLVTDGPESKSLVFGTTGHPIDGPSFWPYSWHRDWTISGGRIKELFGSETVRLGEDYMRLVMFHRLGRIITKAEFDGGGTTGAVAEFEYVGNFPELYERFYWQHQFGTDDEEVTVHSNFRLKSDWKEIARNSDRLNDRGGLISKSIYWIKSDWQSLAYSVYDTTVENTTYFSCGYRGVQHNGMGTTVAHTWVKKKDKWWDINLCFLAGTMVTMEDGTKKAIETIDLGESVKTGGRIFACGKFLSDDLHDYHGIKVSGSHMVLENGNWIQVKDSPDSNFISDEVVTTYNFGTENRRLEIEGITFTDYFEMHEKEKLQLVGDEYFNHWRDQDSTSKQKTMEIMNK